MKVTDTTTGAIGHLYVPISGVPPTTSPVSDQTATGGAALSGTASFGLTSGAPAIATVDFGDGTGPQVATVSDGSLDLSSVTAPTVPGSFTTSIQILNTALQGGFATVAFAVSTNTAPTASVKEVDFSASNTADFHPVTDDLSGVSYATAQWLDGVSEPVCYTRSGTTNDSGGNAYLTATVTMDVTGFPGGSPEVKASINGVDTVPVDPALNADDTQLTATVTSSSALPNTIAKTNETIAWYVSNDGGTTWISAGPATVNRAYIVNGISLSGAQLIETVLNIGCVNADGMAPPQDIVSQIWDNSFQTRKVTPLHSLMQPLQPMHYWGDQSVGMGPPGDPVWQSVADLIRYGDGRCGAWSRLFVAVLGAQGVTAYIVEITPDLNPPSHFPNGQKTPYEEPNSMLQKPVLLVASTTVAQGGNAKRDDFNNHWVVELSPKAPGNPVYDPSYGNWLPNQQAYIDYSMKGTEYETATSKLRFYSYPKGLAGVFDFNNI